MDGVFEWVGRWWSKQDGCQKKRFQAQLELVNDYRKNKSWSCMDGDRLGARWLSRVIKNEWDLRTENLGSSHALGQRKTWKIGILTSGGPLFLSKHTTWERCTDTLFCSCGLDHMTGVKFFLDISGIMVKEQYVNKSAVIHMNTSSWSIPYPNPSIISAESIERPQSVESPRTFFPTNKAISFHYVAQHNKADLICKFATLPLDVLHAQQYRCRPCHRRPVHMTTTSKAVKYPLSPHIAFRNRTRGGKSKWFRVTRSATCLVWRCFFEVSINEHYWSEVSIGIKKLQYPKKKVSKNVMPSFFVLMQHSNVCYNTYANRYICYRSESKGKYFFKNFRRHSSDELQMLRLECPTMAFGSLRTWHYRRFRSKKTRIPSPV